MAILLGVIGQFKNGAKNHQTRLTMQGAMDIAAVYRGELGSTVNHLAQINTPIDWSTVKSFTTGVSGSAKITGSGANDREKAANAFSERLAWAAHQLPLTLNMTRSLKNQNALVDTDGDNFYEIVDGWNKPIAYAAFVKYVEHGDTYTDDDFLPANRTYFFASAGPDGDFGDASTQPEATGVRADNIYSFDMDMETTR